MASAAFVKAGAIFGPLTSLESRLTTHVARPPLGVPVVRGSNPRSPVLDFDGQGNEILYRSMDPEQADWFTQTGVVSGEGETSMSAVRAYSEAYDGTTFRITLRPGTSARVREVGVADKNSLSDFPDLPPANSGWGAEHARFKVERNQVTTQVGTGRALDIIKANTLKREVVRPHLKYPSGHKPGPYYESQLPLPPLGNQ